MKEIFLDPMARKVIDEIFILMEKEYLTYHSKLPGKAKTKRQQGSEA